MDITATNLTIERKYNLGNYQMLTLTAHASIDDTPTSDQHDLTDMHAQYLRLLTQMDRAARLYQDTNEPC